MKDAKTGNRAIDESLKDVSGNIRTFRTEEIIEVDENLVEINDLKREINDLKALLVQQLQPKQQTQQTQNPPQVVENQKSDINCNGAEQCA